MFLAEIIGMVTDVSLLFKCQPMDLACVETQIGNGEAADCEVIEVGPMIVQVI